MKIKITKEPDVSDRQNNWQFEFEIDGKYKAYARYENGYLTAELLSYISGHTNLCSLSFIDIYEEYIGGYDKINWSDVKKRIENIDIEPIEESVRNREQEYRNKIVSKEKLDPEKFKELSEATTSFIRHFLNEEDIGRRLLEVTDENN